MSNYKDMMDEIKASDALKKRVILSLNNLGKEKRKGVSQNLCKHHHRCE